MRPTRVADTHGLHGEARAEGSRLEKESAHIQNEKEREREREQIIIKRRKKVRDTGGKISSETTSQYLKCDNGFPGRASSLRKDQQRRKHTGASAVSDSISHGEASRGALPTLVARDKNGLQRL